MIIQPRKKAVGGDFIGAPSRMECSVLPSTAAPSLFIRATDGVTKIRKEREGEFLCT